MSENYYFYASSFVIAFLVSFLLGVYTYKNRSDKIHTYFILVMTSVSIWSLGAIFELISPDISTKIIGATVSYLGVATIAPFLFMFTLSYVNKDKYLNRANILILMAIPILIITLAFTNNWHGLIWSKIYFTNTYLGPILTYQHNIGVWINMIYSYSLLISSIALLSYILINSPRIYKFQVSAVLIGIIFPFIFNIFYALSLFPDPVDMTPLAFSITAILMAIGVFKYHLLDILPIAHDKLFESVDSAYLVFDRNNRLLEMNYKASQILGISSRDIGLKFDEILNKNEFKEFMVFFHDKKMTHEEIQLKKYFNQWFQIQKSFIYDKIEISGFLITLSNITERKKSEMELKESQRMLKTLMSNLPGMAYRCRNDRNWTMEFVSEGCLELTGYPAEDIINNKKISYASLIVSEDEEYVWNQIQKSVLKKEPFEVIYRIHTLDSEEKIVWEKGRGIFSNDDKLLALEGFINDVTASVNAEKRLKKSLKEKEVLLQEIHHRVKNNMQIISSLLNLQTAYSQLKTPQEILKETQDRVKAMALIHEKLYQSKNLEEIDFGEYINSLISMLSQSYNISKININIETSSVSLDINTSIPCGLIINELVTNSIKHAFPDAEGRIDIKFLKSNSELILTVADNGMGLPDKIEIEKGNSLGLKLVKSLVKQLDGDLTIGNENGTIFKITFQELKYKKRL